MRDETAFATGVHEYDADALVDLGAPALQHWNAFRGERRARKLCEWPDAKSAAIGDIGAEAPGRDHRVEPAASDQLCGVSFDFLPRRRHAFDAMDKVHHDPRHLEEPARH
jgi:hypothetical protein